MDVTHDALAAGSVCCSVLRCVAVSCSVLQCVAACCSMLHVTNDSSERVMFLNVDTRPHLPDIL